VGPGREATPEHYDRIREALGAARVALTSTVVAVGFAAVGLTGHVWAFVPAAIAVLFAVVDAPLAWRAYRAAKARELAELLACDARRAVDAHAGDYDVDPAVLPAGQAWCYIDRHFEDRLREALLAALAGEGPRLVMLCGESKSGKTRAAFQALRAEELKDAWLVVPRDGSSVEALLRAGTLPSHWAPLVVWLDDIERYARPGASGLHASALREERCDRPVALLATEGGRASRRLPGESDDALAQLRSLAACIEVPVMLDEEELAAVRREYGDRLTAEVAQVGLGRRMVAFEELRNRLTRSRDGCREGHAVIRAAIDWRRAGAQRPLRAQELQALYQDYLPEDLDPGEELFASGLRWAREPLPDTQIALLRKAKGCDAPQRDTQQNARDRAFEPYDLAVEVARTEWPAVSDQALASLLTVAEPQDFFQMAGTAFDAGNAPLALDLLERAERSEDRALQATSAYDIGVLRAHIGDLSGAEAAYRRADERGSQRGAFNLGQLLRQRGDLPGAEVAYRRADERGSAEGAVNLGALLEQSGDVVGAEAAYGRAQQRGNQRGARNLQRLAVLGVLLLCACLALSGAVLAAQPLGGIEEFPFSRNFVTEPEEMTLDGEGNVWLLESIAYLSPLGAIQRIAPNGTVTGDFSLPESYLSDIALGPDGNMWFTDDAAAGLEGPNHIGRITPTGAVREFPIPHSAPKPYEGSLEGPHAIAEGVGEDLWFTNWRPNTEGKYIIGRITTAGTITEFPIPAGRAPNLPEVGFPVGIALGADGNMWFTDDGQDQESRNLIGRITSKGTVTEFPLPTIDSYPRAIALGADGNMWFTETGASKIGRITPTGEITEFPVAGVGRALHGIVLGGDGYMWYTGSSAANALGWITPTGAVRDISTTALEGATPVSLAAGSSDQIWFTDPKPTSRESPAPSFVGRFTTPFAPASITSPSLSGQAAEKDELTVTEGTWTNAPAVSYLWQRCDAAGLGCQNINGELRNVHYLSSTDVGHTLRALVTAENTIGATSAVSNLSPVIVAAPTSPAPGPRPRPQPSRPPTVAATLTWRFIWTSRYTSVKSLLVHGLSAGAVVEVACRGRGCAFAHFKRVAAHRVCHKHRCTRRASGTDGALELAGYFKARRMGSGVRFSVRIVERGSIGKSFLFATRRNDAPSVNVVCLAPGSTTTETSC